MSSKGMSFGNDDIVYARIAEGNPRDTGRGYARLDPLLYEVLGINVGDAIEIINPLNNLKTAALTMRWRPEDRSGVIIDGFSAKHPSVHR